MMNTQLSMMPDVTVHKTPLRETAVWRVAYGADTPALADLLAVLIGGNQAEVAAERLLARFGQASEIDAAPADELAATPGISRTTAARLKAALALGRRLMDPPEERVTIRSPGDAAALLKPLLIGKDQEYLYVLLLDTRNRVIGAPLEIYHGSLNTSLIRVGELFKNAVRINAAAIVVGHNHPSGDPSPSPEDVAVTRALVEAGKLLDISLLDHIVVGNPRWVSLKERGLGFS
jgi:DNA repair protein RadC